MTSLTVFTDGDGTLCLPECPVRGCDDFRSFNEGRMMDHLTDDHDIWDILLHSEVVIR